MYKLYCRSFQGVMKVSTLFLPWREPQLLEGENSLAELPRLIKREGIETVLIVSDTGIAATGLMDGFLDGMRREGITFAMYDKTVPNPTIDNIEEALQLYKANDCQGLVAFGGGSSIDCAKGVGARLARPSKTIPQMKGILKVNKKMPPLFVVPTTAGTGSEATLACVVSNSETHEKYALMDTALIPHFAVLDPLLTVKLPRHITSTTGMDALTHAVEAYIGKSNTKQTRQWSVDAVKLIFENLYEAYSNGDNIAARTNMQKAAYLAGMAFTRAYVGNVHAIAHTLSGFYNVPHGLANAVILPHVLDYYGESVHEPLAELADAAGVCAASESTREKAMKFIQAIKDLNEEMDISVNVDCIIDSDIPLMAERAIQEANPLYPVPKILLKEDMDKLLRTIGA
ncbi:iron-containing alcohol dehydrogenase [Sporosarcina luteola]|uniref:iron-containing alcohol dehydrogenase n=1 Tax=Sporosarcina luteola TaxID=582850 RepID=UPI002040A0BF|nr:iron-containing alcohol dehydrogenase [Sporosarcina luteola]MCM3638974.1 iron-containing alcohol dehydrogenase [Sporosarcina luteola]